MPTHRPALPVAMLVACLAATGCGKEGRPMPPEPRGPLPAGSVEARQIGSRVVVALTVPEPRGSQIAQQPVAVEILRVAYAPGLAAPVDAEAFRLRGEFVAGLERDPLEPGARLLVEDPSVAALERGPEGWTLRYAVRVRDRRGRPSPLVAATDLVMAADLPAPGAPGAEATADGVHLRWPAAGDAAKFNVYRAREEGPFGERPLNPQPLSSPDYLDAEAQLGARYRYSVRQLAAEGAPPRESASSVETTVLAEDRFAPGKPDGLVAVQEGNAVRLFWSPNGERDLAGYRLYRRAGEGAWERIGPDPIVEPLFLDAGVSAGARVEYRVAAIDRATPANESAASDAIDVNVVADPLSPAERRP
jgi:hypothetical protein